MNHEVPVHDLTVFPTFLLLLVVLVGVVLAGGFFKSQVATANEPSAATMPEPKATETSVPDATAAPIPNTLVTPVLDTEAAVLSATAYGEVSFGDRLEDVAKRLNEIATPRSESEEDYCYHVEFEAYPGVSFMVQRGRVNRLDTSEPIVTSIGYSVGASMDEIKKAIPTAIIEPNHYDSEDHYITVMSDDGKAAILMDESKGKVVNVRGGLLPAVQYVEGCL